MLIFLDIDGVLFDKRNGRPYDGAAQALDQYARANKARIVWTSSRRATATRDELVTLTGISAPVAGATPRDGARYDGDSFDAMNARRAAEITAVLASEGFPRYLVIDDGDMTAHGLRQVVTSPASGLQADQLASVPPMSWPDDTTQRRAAAMRHGVELDG